MAPLTSPHLPAEDVAVLPGEVEPGWFWAGKRGLPEVRVMEAWLPAPRTPNPKPGECKGSLQVTEGPSRAKLQISI